MSLFGNLVNTNAYGEFSSRQWHRENDAKSNAAEDTYPTVDEKDSPSRRRAAFSFASRIAPFFHDMYSHKNDVA